MILVAVLQASTAGQLGGPYPPSFDNNPMVFGWALFARLLIFLLSAASLIRIRSRNRSDRVAANHPVYYHRTVLACLLWALLLGSLSDDLTYLFWGEVSVAVTAHILLASRMLDAMTMLPFIMALFVPFWLRWLCRLGLVEAAPAITLNGVVNDVRATWDSGRIPLILAIYSAATAALVTVMKYWLWIEHGRP